MYSHDLYKYGEHAAQVTDTMARELFDVMDTDHGGEIDHEELIGKLYPTSTLVKYGAKRMKSKMLVSTSSMRILGRRTAPFQPFLIPYRAPHGFTPRS